MAEEESRRLNFRYRIQRLRAFVPNWAQVDAFDPFLSEIEGKVASASRIDIRPERCVSHAETAVFMRSKATISS